MIYNDTGKIVDLRIARGVKVPQSRPVRVVVGGTREHYYETVRELKANGRLANGSHPVHLTTAKDLGRIQGLELSESQVVRLEPVDRDIEAQLAARIRAQE